MMALMNWPLLARAVIDRRVDMGYPTRDGFAAASGLSARLLTDLERNRRTNYDQVTLVRLEKALKWPEGKVRSILTTPEGPKSPSRVEEEFATRAGLAPWVRSDDMPLVEMLHRSGLSTEALFDLIHEVRAIKEEQVAELMHRTAALIRTAGGWAPESPYPPMWIIEEREKDKAAETNPEESA